MPRTASKSLVTRTDHTNAAPPPSRSAGVSSTIVILAQTTTARLGSFVDNCIVRTAHRSLVPGAGVQFVERQRDDGDPSRPVGPLGLRFCRIGFTPYDQRHDGPSRTGSFWISLVRSRCSPRWPGADRLVRRHSERIVLPDGGELTTAEPFVTLRRVDVPFVRAAPATPSSVPEAEAKETVTCASCPKR